MSATHLLPPVGAKAKRSLRILLLSFQLLLLAFSSASAQTPQYQTDQAAVTQPLNDFWTLQGLGRPSGTIKANWAALLRSSDWYEWNSLKVDWTDDQADKDAQRSLLLGAKIDGINPAGVAPAGYVWPSNDNRYWFGLHEHFDQMPRFVCAVYNDYVWSHDRAFLQKMQPKLEAVMGYLGGTMRGRSGLPTCPGVFTGLANTGPPVTYMDCYREGGEVTWIDEEYYTALWDMAAMESVLGNRARAAAYAGQARQYPARFHARLWNESTGCYAGWKDSGGALHDYGFTYLNLEALARGLGNPTEAYQIFDWLDNGTAQPTTMGGHKGSTDVYQCVVAPRSNTETVPDADWDVWSVSKSLRASTYGYGALVEDGGAMLWVNYYDVLARLKWLDADSAWRKLTDMLYRVVGDPLRFTESAGHPTNAYGENYLEVGPADGPEIGLSGTTPLYGFMGIQARPDGLYCSPNLPTSLLFLTSNAVHYGSSAYSLRVARGRVVTEVAPLGQTDPPNQAAPLTAATAQPFTAEAPFNTVGVCLTALDSSTPRVSVRLERRRGTNWTTVAASGVAVRYQNLYHYAPVPVQPPGNYQIVLMPVAGAAGWPQRDGRYSCRAADVPMTRAENHALRPSGADFTSPRAFSEIEVRTPGRTPRRVTLTRKFGGHWRPVEVTWTETSGGGVLGFADQPAGSYRLWLEKAPAGTYALLSSRYTVTITSGAVSMTHTVAAGETVWLTNDPHPSPHP